MEENQIDRFLNPEIKEIEVPDEESSDESDGKEGLSINPPVKREKMLTKAQRKRRREHKLVE